MKKLLLLAFVVFGFLSNAQDEELPSVVETNFSSEFPNAQESDWFFNGKYYEFQFTQSGKDLSALYDGKGNLVETVTAVDPAALPASVSKSVNSKYADNEMYDAYKIEEGKTKKSFYRLTLMANDKTYTLEVSATGEITKTTVISDSDEEE